MLAVDAVVGNVHDDADLADARDDHAAAGTLERVAIDADERVKSRLRVTTDAGTDVGIAVDRPELRGGDVLVADDDRMIVLTFADREALAVDLPADATVDAALALGHRIGNQHWDLAVDGEVAYVPLDADLHIVEDVLDGALPAGTSTRVETVEASLFVDHPDDGRHAHGGVGTDGSHDNTRDGGRDHTHAGDSDHSHARTRDDVPDHTRTRSDCSDDGDRDV